MTPLPRPALLLLLHTLALATGACRAPEEPPPVRPIEAAAPWTNAFQRPAVLVAEEVRIEGPADLLAHFAGTQDPANTDYVTRTTTEGLLQETKLKPGAGVEIRGQLDALQVVAQRRLVVLQRPSPDAPVVVVGRGNAWWARVDGSEERRDDVVELRGNRGR